MIDTLVAKQAFQKLSQDSEENRQCFDCGSPNPTWASLPNAVLICLPCSGIHRSMGVHISFVRSTTLDAWSDKQIKMMLLGGNDKLKEYFTKVGIYNEEHSAKDFQWKYRTKAASYYREMIKARSEDREVPSEPSMEEALQDDTTLVRAQPVNTSNIQPMNLQYQPINAVRPLPEEDPLDKMKTFFVTGLQKTQAAAKEMAKKVEDKYNDEQFQAKLNGVKTDISKKSSELADKTKVAAEKGYEQVKTGATNLWGFLKTKFNEVQGNPPPTPPQGIQDFNEGLSISTQAVRPPEEQKNQFQIEAPKEQQPQSGQPDLLN